MSKTALEFILRLTDYFHGHWEDPEWGRAPVNQLLIALAVRELAAGLHDPEARAQIHGVADRVVAKSSQAIVRT